MIEDRWRDKLLGETLVFIAWLILPIYRVVIRYKVNKRKIK